MRPLILASLLLLSFTAFCKGRAYDDEIEDDGQDGVEDYYDDQDRDIEPEEDSVDIAQEKDHFKAQKGKDANYYWRRRYYRRRYLYYRRRRSYYRRRYG